ncbi:MAG: hypothetical protein ACLFU2_13745 [Opitutales bacterium]
MDDFLASRRQISAPRTGSAVASKTTNASSRAGLGALRAEVKGPNGETDPTREPRIETVMSGGRLRRLHIHCKCGEEIVVHCEYPE